MATVLDTVEDYRVSLRQQAAFLQEGGVFRTAIGRKVKSGEMAHDDDYEYHEYPKWVTVTYPADAPARTVIVQNADEEDRILAGGKSDSEVEQYRQELITRCKTRGITVDRAWSVARIEKEIDRETVRPVSVDPNAELRAQVAEAESKALHARLEEANRAIALMQAEKQQATATAAPVIDPPKQPTTAPVVAAPAADEGELLEELRIEAEGLAIDVDATWNTTELERQIRRARRPRRTA